jgi:hypothetical protein
MSVIEILRQEPAQAALARNDSLHQKNMCTIEGISISQVKTTQRADIAVGVGRLVPAATKKYSASNDMTA